MKFFLDANMPHLALSVFEEFNLEAVHAKDVGLSKADDTEILEYAAKSGSILVTKDIEFANTNIFPIKSHCGVIVLRLPHFYTAYQINNSLRDFLKLVNLKDLENSITIIKPGRYRIRKPE